MWVAAPWWVVVDVVRTNWPLFINWLQFGFGWGAGPVDSGRKWAVCYSQRQFTPRKHYSHHTGHLCYSQLKLHLSVTHTTLDSGQWTLAAADIEGGNWEDGFEGKVLASGVLSMTPRTRGYIWSIDGRLQIKCWLIGKKSEIWFISTHWQKCNWVRCPSPLRLRGTFAEKTRLTGHCCLLLSFFSSFDNWPQYFFPFPAQKFTVHSMILPPFFSSPASSSPR